MSRIFIVAILFLSLVPLVHYVDVLFSMIPQDHKTAFLHRCQTDRRHR